MRAKHWLIGCTLCFAGIGSAAATNLDTQDLDNSPRAASDGNNQHDDVNSGCGDVLGPARDCPAHSSNDNTGSTSSNGNDRSGSATSTPAHTRQPHLGWQSLLPGSIQ
jgi:hypothetical protein